jgi:hypothetical protein
MTENRLPAAELDKRKAALVGGRVERRDQCSIHHMHGSRMAPNHKWVLKVAPRSMIAA